MKIQTDPGEIKQLSKYLWNVVVHENSLISKPEMCTPQLLLFRLKFIFSMKGTKIDEIYTANLTLCSKCQISGEDFVNFCGLLRKHELYISCIDSLGT